VSIRDFVPRLPPPHSRSIARSATRLVTLAVASALAACSDHSGVSEECTDYGCVSFGPSALVLGDDVEGFVGVDPMLTEIRGTIYLAHQDQRDQLQVFLGSGEFGGTLGRQGEGPGEFRRIMDVDQDSAGLLVVWDGGGSRVSRFEIMPDSEHRLVGAIQVSNARATRGGVTVLPDGGFLVNAYVTAGGGTGRNLHRLNPDGSFLWSVDAMGRSDRRSDVQWRAVAMADDSTFWAAPRTGSYRIDRRRLADGELIDSLLPNRAWYDERNDVQEEGGQHIGPSLNPPNIVDIHVDSDGLLWVLGNYTTAEGNDVVGHGVVDVFAIETGALVASRTEPPGERYFSGFDQSGRLIEVVLEGSALRIHLRKPEIIR